MSESGPFEVRCVKQGPHAVVTGAASGIGSAVATVLHRKGWEVALLDIAEEVHAAAERLGPGACAFTIDVSEARRVEAVAAEVSQRWRKLDGLVMAAGIEVNERLEQLRQPDWDRVLGVDLTSQYLGLRAFLALLRAGRGAVVCLGSVLGRAAYPGAAAYAAAKAGLEGLVRAAAVDCAPDVRVNCVLPGTTDTPMLRREHAGAALEALLNEAGASVPLGRVARPEEIAAVVAFLVSHDAAYMTGSSVVVDGGLLAKLGSNV